MLRLKTKWKFVFLVLLVFVFITGVSYIRFDVETPKKNDNLIQQSTFRGYHKQSSRGSPGLETSGENVKESTMRKTTTQFRYIDMDSSQKAPWEYDKRFKNPCWYEDDVLKCLPYFYIVGMKKCGTTSLNSKLRLHPDSVRPGFKESHFFDWRRIANVSMTENIYNYIDMYADAAKQIEDHSRNLNSTNAVNKRIFSEAAASVCRSVATTVDSTSLLYMQGDASPAVTAVNYDWINMPSNIGLKEPKYVNLDYVHRVGPTAKLIMIVRDPVDRFYSDYYFTLGRERHTDLAPLLCPEHFDQLTKKMIADFNLCLESNTLRSCVYNRTVLTFALSHSTGIYHVFWEELLRIFPREQLYLTQTKDLDDDDNIHRILKFLELDPADEVLSFHKQVNSRRTQYASHGPMFNSTRKILHDFYKSYNERLAALTGDEKFLFSNFFD